MRFRAKPVVEKTPVLNQTRLTRDSATTAPACSFACSTTWRTGPCVPAGNMSIRTWPTAAKRCGLRAHRPQKSRTPRVSGSIATNRLKPSMPAYCDAPLSRYSRRKRLTRRRLPGRPLRTDLVIREPEAERAGPGDERLHQRLLGLHRVLQVVRGPRVQHDAQRDRAVLRMAGAALQVVRRQALQHG